jgi:hypothetical protein
MPPIIPITLALLQRGALKTMFVPIPVSRSFTYTLTVPTLPSSLAREAAPAVSATPAAEVAIIQAADLAVDPAANLAPQTKVQG